MAKKVNTPQADKKLVGVEEVADYTGMSIPFIWKAKAKMGLPYYKIGRLVKFRLSEIELWLKQRQVAS